MPKPYTSPILYDDLQAVSISFLRKHGYLKPNQWKTGTMTWYFGEGENKRVTGSITIATNTNMYNPYFELDYKCNGTPINYRVDLVSVPSNLGKGEVWYFMCPLTNKRCRKLYLVDTYFYHRLAYTGCMYDKQTKSHKWREYQKMFDCVFGREDIAQQLYSKHFKTYYAGKPTKRYLRLMKNYDNNISLEQIEALFDF
jgi:hypothetical protein